MKLVLTMKKIYHSVENSFDKFSSYVLNLLGSSITFILALLLVGWWLLDRSFFEQTTCDMIRDIILSITFISFFIIQKSFNRYTKALHIKLNELVAAHDNANNNIVNIEGKTEQELTEIAKEYESFSEAKNESKD